MGDDDDDDGGGGEKRSEEKTNEGSGTGKDTRNVLNESMEIIEEEEYIQQINTINIKFPYNRWLKREEVKELIYNKTGAGSISSIYDKISYWRVKFKTKEHFDKVMTEGITYKYQEKEYSTKPEEVFSNATEVTVSKVPEEIPDRKLQNLLLNFGDVKSIKRQIDEDGVENGVRKCKIVLENQIPPVIKLPDNYTGEEIDIFYISRPRNTKNFSNWCYICHQLDHEVDICPRKKKCKICGGKGKPHLERHCLERKKFRNPLPTPSEKAKKTQEENEISARNAAPQAVKEIASELEKQLKEKPATVPKTQTKEKSPTPPVEKTQQSESSSILSTSGEPKEEEILFIGDSQIARMGKKVTNKKVVVRALSGAGFQRIEHQIKNEQRSFDKIVIYGGTNDTMREDDENKRRITDLIREGKEHTKDLFVCGIVPILGRSEGRYGCDAMNNKLRQMAIEQHVTFIPKPECFNENKAMDSLYEQDMTHVSDSGAVKLVDNINLFVRLKEPDLKRVHDVSPAVTHKAKKKTRSSAIPLTQ